MESVLFAARAAQNDRLATALSSLGRTLPRLLSLFVVITFGCGPVRRVEPCSPSATNMGEPPILMALVGQPVDLELVLAPAVFCPQGNPVATAVVTEVLDALNQPVAHVHDAPLSSNTAGYSTRVTFSPLNAGVHYLTARFEPALGTTHRQLQVALERSGEPPFTRATLGALCDEVLPLRDVVLCRRGTQLSLMRDGGVSSTERVVAVASAGPVGWVWTDSRLSRLNEADGGLERTDLTLALSRGAVAVTADRWVQGSGSQFMEVRFADGGLSERRWSLEAGAAPITGPGLGLAGDVLGWATPTKLCKGAPDASVRCVESALQPLAGEGNAIWLRGAQSGVVAIARFEPGEGNPQVIFVPAQGPALTDARLSRPVFSWSGRLVAVRADDLSFEAWRSPGPIARQSVTESYVVFQLQSGETVIFSR